MKSIKIQTILNLIIIMLLLFISINQIKDKNIFRNGVIYNITGISAESPVGSATDFEDDQEIEVFDNWVILELDNTKMLVPREKVEVILLK